MGTNVAGDNNIVNATGHKNSPNMACDELKPSSNNLVDALSDKNV